MLQKLGEKRLLVREGGHGEWGPLLEDLLKLAVEDLLELSPLLLKLGVLSTVLLLSSVHRHL